MFKIEYISKLKGLLTKPSETINQYKSENEIKSSFLFMLFSIILSSIILFIFQMSINISLQESLMGAAKTTISYLVFTIIFAILFHGVSKIFKNKKSFVHTFKSFAYMSAVAPVSATIVGISLFLPIISLVNILVQLWGLNILEKGFRQFAELKTWNLVLSFIISILLLGTIMFVIENVIGFPIINLL